MSALAVESLTQHVSLSFTTMREVRFEIAPRVLTPRHPRDLPGDRFPAFSIRQGLPSWWTLCVRNRHQTDAPRNCVKRVLVDSDERAGVAGGATPTLPRWSPSSRPGSRGAGSG
jgi:hypothetical protein